MEDPLSSSQSGEDSVQVFLQEIEGKMGKNTIEALVTTLKSKDSTFVETLKRVIVEQFETFTFDGWSVKRKLNLFFILNKFATDELKHVGTANWEAVFNRLLEAIIPETRDGRDAGHISKLLKRWTKEQSFSASMLQHWNDMFDIHLKALEFEDDTAGGDSEKDARKRGQSASEDPIEEYKEMAVKSMRQFLYRVYEHYAQLSSSMNEHLHWRIVITSAFWLLNRFCLDFSLVHDDLLTVCLASLYLAGKSEQYFMRTEKLRVVAQKYMVKFFGPNCSLPSDDQIFRYEMELLHCISFDIAAVENPCKTLRDMTYVKVIDQTHFQRITGWMCKEDHLVNHAFLWQSGHDNCLGFFYLLSEAKFQDDALRTTLQQAFKSSFFRSLGFTDALHGLFKRIQSVPLTEIGDTNSLRFSTTAMELYDRYFRPQLARSASKMSTPRRPPKTPAEERAMPMSLLTSSDCATSTATPSIGTMIDQAVTPQLKAAISQMGTPSTVAFAQADETTSSKESKREPVPTIAPSSTMATVQSPQLPARGISPSPAVTAAETAAHPPMMESATVPTGSKTEAVVDANAIGIPHVHSTGRMDIDNNGTIENGPAQLCEAQIIESRASAGVHPAVDSERAAVTVVEETMKIKDADYVGKPVTLISRETISLSHATQPTADSAKISTVVPIVAVAAVLPPSIPVPIDDNISSSIHHHQSTTASAPKPVTTPSVFSRLGGTAKPPTPSSARSVLPPSKSFVENTLNSTPHASGTANAPSTTALEAPSSSSIHGDSASHSNSGASARPVGSGVYRPSNQLFAQALRGVTGAPTLKRSLTPADVTKTVPSAVAAETEHDPEENGSAPKRARIAASNDDNLDTRSL